MADELTRSITRLCVTAEMLMEDIIPEAISTQMSDLAERGAKLAELRQASADIAALLAAAKVLHRHSDLSS